MSLYDDFLKTQGGGPEDPTPTTPKPTTTKTASGGGLFADFQATQVGTKQPSDTSVVTPPVKMSPDVVSAVDGFGKTTYEPSEKPSTLKKIWYGLGAGAKGFIQQIGTGINEYNKFAYGKVLGGKDIFGADYEATYQKDKAVLDKYAATTQAKLEANLGTEGANSFVTQASEGLVQGAGQIASFFVNPVVGFTTIAAQTIGAGKNAYDEAYTSSIAQGKTPDEARRIGNINGIATGIINTLEIIPVGRAVGLGEKLLGGSLEKGLAKTATRLLTDVAIESGTEGIQQAGQDLTAKLTYDKDRHVVRNAINAALTAIPSALLFAGVGEGGKRANDKLRDEVLQTASVNLQNQMIESGIPAEKAKAIADQAVAQYAVMGDEDVFDIPEVMNAKPIPEEIAQQVEITPEPVQQVAENVDVTPAPVKPKPATESEKYASYSEKTVLTPEKMQQKGNKPYAGINPENIMHFNQGANARVTLIVPAKDKLIISAGSKLSQMKAGEAAANARSEARQQLEALNISEKEAVALYEKYKKIARENADKQNPVLLNTIKKEAPSVPKEPTVAPETPAVAAKETPAIITPKMTSDLTSQGFTPEEISVMKPETAQKILKTVGGGETKASKLALGIEAQAIERKIQTQGFDNLSESERSVMKDQRAMAEDLLSTDPEKAKRIALGQEEAPADMLSSVLFQKVVEDAAQKILKTVGGGETKASKLALGIEAQAIERKIQTQGFDNLSESERSVMKDQRAMAEDLLSTDPEKAKRIALGQEEAPADMLSSVLFQKVVEDAAKRADGQLLAQLANSPLNNEATAAGQFIRGLAEFRDGGSAFKNIQKVTKSREKAVEKNLKDKTISKAKKEIVNDIKAEIKKQKPKIKEWVDLVNSLEC
jgi:hypothetical protein